MDQDVSGILNRWKRVAVVGASPDPKRPSHHVTAFLLSKGYEIFPVNPKADEILGIPSWPDLASVPKPLEIVDVFRRPEAAIRVAEEAVRQGAKVLWLQPGSESHQAVEIARQGGLLVVAGRCMMAELKSLEG